MKKLFLQFLKELLSDLKSQHNPTPSIVDDDGEIDDDKYQNALEMQWDNEDKDIYRRIDVVRMLIEKHDEMEEHEWYQSAFKALTAEGYKIIFSRNF